MISARRTRNESRASRRRNLPTPSAREPVLDAYMGPPRFVQAGGRQVAASSAEPGAIQKKSGARLNSNLARDGFRQSRFTVAVARRVAVRANLRNASTRQADHSRRALQDCNAGADILSSIGTRGGHRRDERQAREQHANRAGNRSWEPEHSRHSALYRARGQRRARILRKFSTRFRILLELD